MGIGWKILRRWGRGDEKSFKDEFYFKESKSSAVLSQNLQSYENVYPH